MRKDNGIRAGRFFRDLNEEINFLRQAADVVLVWQGLMQQQSTIYTRTDAAHLFLLNNSSDNSYFAVTPVFFRLASGHGFES